MRSFGSSLWGSTGTERARTSLSNYRQWVSLAAFDGPVPCGRTRGADSCRGSPRRASVAPRSAVPLRLHPRQRLHAEVGVAPVHSQVEKSCPQRFQQSPPYSRGTRCPLLPTRTSRSLRDITHWQPTLWRSQLVRVVPRAAGRAASRTPGSFPVPGPTSTLRARPHGRKTLFRARPGSTCGGG
jgi:hypothetical protein